MSEKRLKVAIAGASGFVGRALIDSIKEEFDIIALSRSERSSSEGIEWRACDLFSLLQAEESLIGADIGVFLVHSMLPSSRLTQGRFEDLDALVADNFARACSKAGVKQILYLGGLMGEKREELSRHLESRFEVEKVFAQSSIALTTLRAGLIVGPGGSSFLMLLRLVQRLPIMILPRWTKTKTQPIDLRDVILAIRYCLNRESCYSRSFDLGGPEVLTYAKMIQQTGELNGRRPVFLSFPFFSPKFSSLWVSLVTGAPYSLVSPLVDSLTHQMTANETRLFDEAKIKPRPFKEAVLHTKTAMTVGDRPTNRLKEMKSNRSAVKSESMVRSVQRLPLPLGMRAVDVMDEYLRWLPRLFRFLICVDVDQTGFCNFRLSFIRVSLLKLEVDYDRTTADRPLLRIVGGVLACRNNRGRLEFREMLNREFVVAAIHDYRPRLPWFVYNLTQALMHLWVMRRFRSHLKSIANLKKAT